ncbi:MAG TPA: DMT family transporter [Aquabacterium sp.]|uniref:DMT family transporter n=1 Tax=Aquabacterium sp. TaxID=1872578 RepID=UPI002E2F35D0|nr:DMT family transporter [Aquabacterium sp.]HEX5372050.1 DMT family transporter [Aquabacterium sp.]
MTRPSLLHGYLAALATVVIWAGFILISRLGGKSALSSWDIVALRLGTASLILLPFSLKIERHVWRDPKLWALSLIGGLLFLVLAYAGFKFAPAAHGAILMPGMQPFLVTLLAWLMLGAIPSRQRLWGLLPIALGVACVAVPQFMNAHAGASTLLGDALLLGASLAWAAYSVLVKKWAYDPWLLTRVVALGSAAVFLPVYFLALPRHLDQVPLSMLLLQGLYQGIGPTIVAMVLFLRAVSILGAERTGALVALVPVMAGLGAVPLLDEPLTGWLVAGLVLVSGGALLSARPAQPTVARA